MHRGGAASETVRELDWNKIQTGFTRILPQKSLKFNVDLTGKKTVYISVFTEKGMKIADGLQRESNTNIIVGADGHIYDAQPDEIWLDCSGGWHLLGAGRNR